MQGTSLYPLEMYQFCYAYTGGHCDVGFATTNCSSRALGRHSPGECVSRLLMQDMTLKCPCGF